MPPYPVHPLGWNIDNKNQNKTRRTVLVGGGVVFLGLVWWWLGGISVQSNGSWCKLWYHPTTNHAAVTGDGWIANKHKETNKEEEEETDERGESKSSLASSFSASSSSSSSQFLQSFAASDGDGVLNVHVVPHTHDDVGWRKTVEQYYYGWNTSLDGRGHVDDILTTTVHALLQQSYRTFTYVESKFWYTWWTETATPQERDALRYLVQRPFQQKGNDDNPQESPNSRSYNQWTFVNGGWSMHDEACAHFMGMMDSTTLGHDLLYRELGVIPTIGWQIDPFGHSATQAYLLTHQLGFQALYFGRIDYQDLKVRHDTQQCEGLWQGSGRPNDNPSFVNQQDDKTKNEDDTTFTTTPLIDPTVFWGLTGSYYGNYNPPAGGFCFDEPCCDPANRLLTLNPTALHAKLQTFMESLAVQAQQTRANFGINNNMDLMITMGSDFTYSRAEVFFANLDYLIAQVMFGQVNQQWNVSAIFQNVTQAQIRRVNLFYSSPEYYTDRKYQHRPLYSIRDDVPNETNDTSHSTTTSTRTQSSSSSTATSASSSSAWQLKTDDFFPYSDCPHCFWTGFFTSRTAKKRFERVASGVLQAARQLEFLHLTTRTSKSPPEAPSPRQTQERHDNMPPLFVLEDAFGIAQHHDGITGTEKQHVANDYSKRLQEGLDQATVFVEQWVAEQLDYGDSTTMTSSWQYCGRLNESLCETATNAPWETTTTNTTNTTSNTNTTNALYVVLYNALAQPRGWLVRLPVSVPGTFTVERLVDDLSSHAATPQVVSSQPRYTVARTDDCRITTTTTQALEPVVYQLEFYATDLIPMGAVTYRIAKVPDDNTTTTTTTHDKHNPEEEEPQEEMHSVHDNEGPGLSDPQEPPVQFFEYSIHNATHVQAWTVRGLVVWFNAQTGQLERVSTDNGETSMELELVWGYYLPYDHDLDQSDDARGNSGAYLFRPSTPNASLTPVVPLPLSYTTDSNSSPNATNQEQQWVDFRPTPYGLEVHTAYGEPGDDTTAWIRQVVRIVQDQPWIEVEYTVGPIPMTDPSHNNPPRFRGREVVTRLVAPEIQNQGVFYTDSNGRAFLQRRRNQRPTWDMEVFEPVAGNYYPITTAIYIQDQDETTAGNGSSSLALVTDRARGAGSIVDGSLEVMVNRRTLVDDHRGVDEPLNETCGGQMTHYPPYGNATRIGEGAIVSGIHRIVVGCHQDYDPTESNGARGPRSIIDQAFAQPLVFVATATEDTSSPELDDEEETDATDQQTPRRTTSFSVLGGTELPPNVFLSTWMVRHFQTDPSTNTTTLLVRLAHQYGPGEDSVLSQPVSVNLALLLEPQYTLLSIVEKTLSGNQNWTDFVAHKKYNWTSPQPEPSNDQKNTKPTTRDGAVSPPSKNDDTRKSAPKTVHVRSEPTVQENRDGVSSSRYYRGDNAIVTLGPLDVKTYEIRIAAPDGQRMTTTT